MGRHWGGSDARQGCRLSVLHSTGLGLEEPGWVLCSGLSEAPFHSLPPMLHIGEP